MIFMLSTFLGAEADDDKRPRRSRGIRAAMTAPGRPPRNRMGGMTLRSGLGGGAGSTRSPCAIAGLQAPAAWGRWLGQTETGDPERARAVLASSTERRA